MSDKINEAINTYRKTNMRRQEGSRKIPDTTSIRDIEKKFLLKEVKGIQDFVSNLLIRVKNLSNQFSAPLSINDSNRLNQTIAEIQADLLVFLSKEAKLRKMNANYAGNYEVNTFDHYTRLNHLTSRDLKVTLYLDFARRVLSDIENDITRTITKLS